MEENNCNRGAQSRLPLVGPGDQNLIRKETLAAGRFAPGLQAHSSMRKCLECAPGYHIRGVTKLPYTDKQGQYLTFIHRYIKTRGYSPSESDIQMHFGVAGPTVHQMIVRLETLGLIERIPYTARSIRLLLPEDQLPAAVAARTAAPA